jgi:hypothetical protein
MAYVIVFRSRLRPGVEADYGTRAGGMYELASTMPGLLSSRDYVADDGERVALIEFDTAEHLRAWARDPTGVCRTVPAPGRETRPGFVEQSRHPEQKRAGRFARRPCLDARPEELKELGFVRDPECSGGARR